MEDVNISKQCFISVITLIKVLEDETQNDVICVFLAQIQSYLAHWS